MELWLCYTPLQPKANQQKAQFAMQVSILTQCSSIRPRSNQPARPAVRACRNFRRPVEMETETHHETNAETKTPTKSLLTKTRARAQIEPEARRRETRVRYLFRNTHNNTTISHQPSSVEHQASSIEPRASNRLGLACISQRKPFEAQRNARSAGPNRWARHP